MIDLYTKTVLTVIAVALVGIVTQQAIPGATAQPASTCGQESNPCAAFMMTWGGTKWVRCDDLAPKFARFSSEAYHVTCGLTEAPTCLH